MYKDLFTTFFRIGAFTIGGGYAMIPLIEADVVEKHRLRRQESGWICRSADVNIGNGAAVAYSHSAHSNVPHTIP